MDRALAKHAGGPGSDPQHSNVVHACNPSPHLQAGESGNSRSPSAIWCTQVGQPELLKTLSQNGERKEKEVQEMYLSIVTTSKCIYIHSPVLAVWPLGPSAK